MTDPPVSTLLFLTPDEIEFEDLEVSTLRELALEVDPFLATSALAELAARGAPEAVEVGRRLLDGGTDDRYLLMAAFDLVLEHAPDDARAWLDRRGDTLDEATLAHCREALGQ